MSAASGLTPEDLARAAQYTLVGYDSDPERLREMVNARAKVIGILLADLDRLRADQEEADKLVSYLHDLIYEDDRQTPRVSSELLAPMNATIWTLHNLLRGAGS